jgi:2-polyprenyl-3-methyl-5-hydroxy-6-metoxy-1,4-benzoquinol methylase
MCKSNNFRGENLGVLFQKHDVVEVLECPVCDSSQFSLWADCGYTQAHKCDNCSLVFMSSQLSDSGLADYYSNYIGKRRINNLEKMKLRSDQYILDSSVLKNFIKQGKLLDVGCNGGFFLSALGDKFERYGTELDLTAVEYAKKTYPDFGNNVFKGSIEDTNFEDEEFDAITMRGLFEHVSNPNRVLSHAVKMLKQGGYLYLCATPNGASLCADIYRENWTLFHPVQHLWHFSPDNLATLFEKYGMKLIWKDLQYLGTPYAQPKTDLLKIANKIENPASQEISPPFFENMMSLVFQKT